MTVFSAASGRAAIDRCDLIQLREAALKVPLPTVARDVLDSAPAVERWASPSAFNGPAGRLAEDQTAFTELYEQHAEKVWNFAYRLTGSWAEADDLLSAVFLTAWRRRSDIRLIDGSALPWLYVVTTNVCRSERRRLVRLKRAIPRLLTRDAPDHAEQVAEDDAAADRLVRVLAAVDRLPRAQREAVQLCLLGETSAQDAAQILGISVHSVQSRLARARVRLNQILTQENDA